MRILMLHNRYQLRGGEDESTQAEALLLQQRGHDVDLVEWDNRNIAGESLVATGINAIWSRQVYSDLRRRLEQTRYDVAHVQNFFPLISPAAHHAIHRTGVPLVQALRNYRLLCINGLFYRSSSPCTSCAGRLGLVPGILHRCYRGSRAGSFAAAAMLSFHRAIRTWKETVDVFYTLSGFASRKLVEGGLPEDKLTVKPNFVYPDPGASSSERRSALFVGRLSPEKGVRTLIRAWRSLTDVPLRIIGDGPLGAFVEDAVAKLPHVEWLGQLDAAGVLQAMGSARFLVLPSEWYEPFGRTSIEAFSRGTPVIASAIGAMEEIVAHGETGLHFRAGDSRELAERARWAWEHPQDMAAMGRNARLEFEKRYAADSNYELLSEIYAQAIRNRSRR
jgi:glycosyltransferase involved in cell wall biosynthesis